MPKAIEEGQDSVSERLFVDSSYMLVSNNAIGTDHKGLGNTVNAPIDRYAAVTIRTRARIWIAQRVEPSRCVLRLIFVIDPLDRHGSFSAKVHEERMLGATRGAPRCEDVDERNLAVKVVARQSEGATLNRRKAEFGHGLSDQCRWDAARVMIESQDE